MSMTLWLIAGYFVGIPVFLVLLALLTNDDAKAITRDAFLWPALALVVIYINTCKVTVSVVSKSVVEPIARMKKRTLKNRGD